MKLLRWLKKAEKAWNTCSEQMAKLTHWAGAVGLRDGAMPADYHRTSKEGSRGRRFSVLLRVVQKAAAGSAFTKEGTTRSRRAAGVRVSGGF